MKKEDTMTFRQYLAASGAALFSPLSRLLPKGVLRIAGFSGWLAPLFAAIPLGILILTLHRLLHGEGNAVGLGEAFRQRLGDGAGRVLSGLCGIWLVFYGGFLLRSGGERLMSTVYHSGRLGFFLAALLFLSLLFARGQLRAAGRSAAVCLMLFAGTVALVLTLAIPGLEPELLWPPMLTEPGRLLLSALPVMDVLSPWVWFSFLRGNVTEDGRALRRGLGSMGFMLLLALAFLACTIGRLGAELCMQLQFPFFVMVQNLTLFHVVERFDAVVVAIWMMTDYICIGMVLLSAAEAFREMLGREKRNAFVWPCAAGMLALGFLISRNAFSLAKISEILIPSVNLGLSFLLLPAVSLMPQKKISKNFKKGVDN